VRPVDNFFDLQLKNNPSIIKTIPKKIQEIKNKIEGR
jgi:hypothetical protein